MNMMIDKRQKKPVHVVIIGANSHARVIADIIKCSGDVVEGFLDDREESEFPRLYLLGKIDAVKRLA